MNRYHSVLGSGLGLGYVINSDDFGRVAMRADELGSWVMAEEANQAVKDAFERGKKNGVQLGMLEAATVTNWEFPGLPHEGLRGSTDPVPVSDTRTNQLLNELYHDRARLERVVKNAIELMESAEEDYGHGAMVLKSLDECGAWLAEAFPDQFENKDGEHTGAYRKTANVTRAVMAQFRDTHE